MLACSRSWALSIAFLGLFTLATTEITSLIKPITCPKCKTAVGWFNTAHYTIVKPAMPIGVSVIVAFLTCKCGKRVKFNGRECKNREIAARRIVVEAVVVEVRTAA